NGVGQCKSKFATFGLQQIHVFCRCFGGLCGGFDVIDFLCIKLRKGDTQRVVNTTLTASQDVDELVLCMGGCRGSDGNRRSSTSDPFADTHIGCLLGKWDFDLLRYKDDRHKYNAILTICYIGIARGLLISIWQSA